MLDKERGVKVLGHTLFAVHAEMLVQVLLEYGGLGDWRQLTASEVRFFYDGIRGSLKRQTKKQETPRASRGRKR